MDIYKFRKLNQEVLTKGRFAISVAPQYKFGENSENDIVLGAFTDALTAALGMIEEINKDVLDQMELNRKVTFEDLMKDIKFN